jgi:Domain of unknown function (DUF5979)/Thioester domain
VAAIGLVAVCLLTADAARATWLPGPPPTGASPRGTSQTQVTMNGVAEGQGVSGFAALPGSTFDPVKDGYPSSNPSTGFQPQDEWFAGIILGAPASGGAELRLYCIDLHTETWNGIGYGLGDWSDADVPNVGYVARVLADYYPNTDQPSALSNINQKAAVVQAAVWFFTDRYVLNVDDSLHKAVAALVSSVISAGPIVEPPPPTLTITPASKTGQVGHTVGPFTVNASVDAVVSATGATMWKDAGATQPISNDSKVSPGTQIWLKSATAGTATLQATANARVPSGNVYLYDGHSPGVTSAQKLILAQTAELQTVVSAQAVFESLGSLKVEKTITGPAAGRQGAITISVSCDKDTPPLDDFTIPAGKPASTVSKTYENITAGAHCTVTETADGHTDAILVTVDGSGKSVTIPANGTVTASLTDTVSFPAPGSLVVHKTITGPAAGQQGTVRIRVICDETPDNLLEVFEIPAGTSGTASKTYSGIPAGARCTVTEFVDGSTSTVQVQIDGSGQTVTVPAGSTQTADLTDTYTSVPGSLTVQKSIAGTAAGRQGEVRIAVDCGKGSPALPDFVIPAGRKDGTFSMPYPDIPAGAVCTATETEDGHTLTVIAVVTGSGGTVTIPPAGTATLDLSDVYSYVPGELVVTKTIGGPAAGAQGEITIVPTCDGTKLDPWVINAGTAAGSLTRVYPAIPAGASCTVTETVDGHTSTVAVAVSGSGREVTIPANATATVAVSDTYTDLPGSLVVNKTITGNAAGKQGQITIEVTCGGTALPDFVIQAGADARTVSKTYAGIAAGSSCTVTESADGHTSTVSVEQTGSGQQVTVPAAGAATATVTDTYSDVPGSLVVRKTIAGPAAGGQGQIVIVATCDGSQLPAFVIPAGKAAGDVTHTYPGIAAGASCSAAESVDGHTDTVAVESSGTKGSVVVPANGSATMTLEDTYSDADGSLVVEKTITGAAAGSQGPITIRVHCDNGAPALEDFVIPAGSSAGTQTQTYGGLPAGATCVADETADGGTSTVVAVVTTDPKQATIPAGDTAVVRLADAYSFAPPSLTVDTNVPGNTPSGTDLPIKVTVDNVGKVAAKAVTVCLQLHQSLALADKVGGNVVRNGACWRIAQLVRKAGHTVKPVARSFLVHAVVRACSQVTVEARGVDLRKAKACTYLLAAVTKQKPGGVTG